MTIESPVVSLLGEKIFRSRNKKKLEFFQFIVSINIIYSNVTVFI